MKRTVVIIVILALVVGGLFAAMKKRAPKAPPKTTQQIWVDEGTPVETSVAVLGDMERSVEVTGDINALDKVTLSAKISGRVARVMAREGDSVSRGTTVISLDSQDAASNLQQAQAAYETAQIRLSQAGTNAKVTRIQTDAAVEQAKANLDAAQARLAVVKKPARSQEMLVAENNVESAKANFDNAEANHNRNKKLLQEGAISAQSFDLTKTQLAVAQTQYKSAKEQLSLVKEGGRSEDVLSAQKQVDVAREALRTAQANSSQNLIRKEDIKQAQAAVRQARAAVDMAKQQLSYTSVTTPVSGQLASRLTEPGQVVAPGQALADVVNLSSVYFKGDISENDLINVKKGDRAVVGIDAIPGRDFVGRVEEIFPTGSTLSRNFPVRIRIDETGHVIKPGMFARGRIVTGLERSVLLVPKDAVDVRKGTNSVFTVGPKNLVKRHIVDVVREDREYAQIALPTDLKAGDVVVTQGRQNLQNGTKVKIESGK